jgi:NitT/TauT family transport system permease protein
VSRSPWLAIRAPLPSRRATIAKIAAFLVPLTVWILVSRLWVPDMVVTDQGDGEYKPGNHLTKAQFDAENARIMESRKDSTLILTDKSFTALRSAGVPDTVLDKLNDRKDMKFNNQKELTKALKYDLEEDEVTKYRDRILENAEKEDKPLMVGEPSTKEWLPTPWQVAKAFYHAFVTPPTVRGEKWLHESLWHSCKIIFWGFVLSAIVGVPLGIVCGTFDLFSKLSEPFIDFIRYMPAPAFGVLCMATLGINDGCKIGIIWIGTFFQMVLVVANTTRQFDEGLLEAAQTLGASKRSLLTRVILPGILPSLYNDMRILLGWAWTYLIVAELIGATSGISEFINREGIKYHHYDKAYAGIIMIGIIGLTCDQILAAVGRYLFPWMPQHKGGRAAWAGFFNALAYLWSMGRTTPASQPSATPTAKKEKQTNV